MNPPKGFATILAIIIAVLVLGGVVYIAQTKKVTVPSSDLLPKTFIAQTKKVTVPSSDLLPKTFQEFYWYSQSTCETANGRSCHVLGCLKPYGETHLEQCKEFAWLPLEIPKKPL